MIAIIVVNYRQTMATLDCLNSLFAYAGGNFHLYLVDNGGDEHSRAAFTAFAAADPGRKPRLSLLHSAKNLGFAGGCNLALEKILADSRFEAVALLNNDCLVEPGWLDAMTTALDSDRNVEMVASRIMKRHLPDAVDSLGITLYRSGIASNRLDTASPLLGPCGGGALYSWRLLDNLRRRDGYVFDPHFFCYAEDTDLALRARGFGADCAYAPGARLLHVGGLTSGCGFNTFIAYQGLRNSLFAMIKNLPAGFLMANLGWIVLLQLAVMAKYLIKGHPGLVWRIYRDVFLALPRLLRQRRHFQTHATWPVGAWHNWTSPLLYDRGYIWATLQRLHHRDLHEGTGPT